MNNRGYFNRTPHNCQAFSLDIRSETGNARNLKNYSLNAILPPSTNVKAPINLTNNRGDLIIDEINEGLLLCSPASQHQEN